MSQGFVYILTSINCPFLKIGGSTQPLIDRIQQINGTPAYESQGPWELSDFLQVTDWQLVEGQMHRLFQDVRANEVDGVRELFNVPATTAREALRSVDPILRVGHEKTRELFRQQDFQVFLYRLMEFAGLFGQLDMQGAWTLSLFPYKGVRHFTLNIGVHEVAFATRPDPGTSDSEFYLVIDSLIDRYEITRKWIRQRFGEIYEADYATAREGAVLVRFRADFAAAENVFAMPGVRRALIAYWLESLALMRERKTKSVHARHHNYDAVHALLEYRRARGSALHRGV